MSMIVHINQSSLGTPIMYKGTKVPETTLHLRSHLTGITGQQDRALRGHFFLNAFNHLYTYRYTYAYTYYSRKKTILEDSNFV